MSIRIENELDFDQIDQVHDEAFQKKFESKLVRELRKTENYVKRLSIVACDPNEKNKIIGHVLFYPIQVSSEQRDIKSLALAPLGVLPSFQKKGIGSKLVFEGLKIANSLGFECVFVLGHNEYYTRFGFKPTLQTWNIKSPFDCEPKYFMAIELPNYLNCLKNENNLKITYPKEYM